MSLLEVSDLQVVFNLPGGRRVHAVRGVNLEVAAGTRFGLVGESGCGKTTTILAAMGLLPPTVEVAGDVRLDGVSLLPGGEGAMRRHRWKDIAMVFQGSMNALNPVQRVGWQIVEPMEFHGIARGSEARRRAGELLETVGIPAEAANRYPHEFSGGMRQRAAIAMALACEPRVLLADEPTTALDVMVQAQILELLVDLTDRLRLALLLVTHDLPVVAQVCHEAAVMYAGEVVERAPLVTLYHSPRHPYTRMLFAATPNLRGTQRIASIPGSPPRLDESIDGCAFASRCDVSFERCRIEHPRLLSIEEAHLAACHWNENPVTNPGLQACADPSDHPVRSSGTTGSLGER
jgi:peptide/nickel transport system ATP-binding protein